MTVEVLLRMDVLPEGLPGRRGIEGSGRGRGRLQGPGPGRSRGAGRAPGLPDDG